MSQGCCGSDDFLGALSGFGFQATFLFFFRAIPQVDAVRISLLTSALRAKGWCLAVPCCRWVGGCVTSWRMSFVSCPGGEEEVEGEGEGGEVWNIGGNVTNAEG